LQKIYSPVGRFAERAKLAFNKIIYKDSRHIAYKHFLNDNTDTNKRTTIKWLFVDKLQQQRKH